MKSGRRAARHETGNEDAARGGLGWVLLVLLLGGLAPARAVELDGVRLLAGGALDLGDVSGGGVSLTLTPDSTPGWARYLGRDFHWEIAATSWSHAAAGGGHVYTLHVGPVWHYLPSILPERSFVEFGSALTRVSERQLRDRDLGAHTHFTTHLSFGWRPRRNSDWHLGLRVRHTSNAGRGDPNPGIDIVMFELGLVP